MKDNFKAQITYTETGDFVVEVKSQSPYSSISAIGTGKTIKIAIVRAEEHARKQHSHRMNILQEELTGTLDVLKKMEGK